MLRQDLTFLSNALVQRYRPMNDWLSSLSCTCFVDFSLPSYRGWLFRLLAIDLVFSTWKYLIIVQKRGFKWGALTAIGSSGHFPRGRPLDSRPSGKKGQLSLFTIWPALHAVCLRQDYSWDTCLHLRPCGNSGGSRVAQETSPIYIQYFWIRHCINEPRYVRLSLRAII